MHIQRTLLWPAENTIVANGQTAAAAEADERMSSIASLENRCIKELEKFSEAGTASALLDDAWKDKHYNDQHNTNCGCDGGKKNGFGTQ